jgi:hypothetical protein
MAFTRRALAVVGVVMFWLFVLVGSGLIVERVVLLLAVAGLVVPVILCAVLARLWEPGGRHRGHHGRVRLRRS